MKLADTLDLGSSVARRMGSSPFSRINIFIYLTDLKRQSLIRKVIVLFI